MGTVALVNMIRFIEAVETLGQMDETASVDLPSWTARVCGSEGQFTSLCSILLPPPLLEIETEQQWCNLIRPVRLVTVFPGELACSVSRSPFLMTCHFLHLQVLAKRRQTLEHGRECVRIGAQLTPLRTEEMTQRAYPTDNGHGQLWVTDWNKGCPWISF